MKYTSWDQITWKGADPSNYTVGRQGTPVRYVTFHHAVGSMESVAQAWNNPGRNGSSHFAVGARGAWQFVDTDDTAWCNTNWNSNLECISIEHEGDWRFGYYSAGCVEESAQLIAWLRKTHPSIIGYNIHRDVALTYTVCPGDLVYAQIWNRSTEILNPVVVAPPVVPAPTPIPGVQVTDIQNRTVVIKKDTHLWDLSFTKWSDAKSVKPLYKGTQVEVSATAKHGLGGVYYLSEYSFSKGIMNGINSADIEELAVKPVDPPVVAPPPVVVPPPVVTPPPVVVPPLDAETVGLFKSIVLKLNDIIKAITDFLTRRGK